MAPQGFQVHLQPTRRPERAAIPRPGRRSRCRPAMCRSSSLRGTSAAGWTGAWGCLGRKRSGRPCASNSLAGRCNDAAPAFPLPRRICRVKTQLARSTWCPSQPTLDACDRALALPLDSARCCGNRRAPPTVTGPSTAIGAGGQPRAVRGVPAARAGFSGWAETARNPCRTRLVDSSWGFGPCLPPRKPNRAGIESCRGDWRTTRDDLSPREAP